MTNKDWIFFFQNYALDFPKEELTARKFIQFALKHTNCFDRTNTFGHFTGSAIIYDPNLNKVLLTHHKKLNKWLQLGGHADGETDVSKVAHREAQEESGISDFTFFPESRLPIDIDVHEIPKNPKEEAHFHFDLRYILLADSKQPLQISDESNDLKWFTIEEALKATEEESLHRLMNKLVFEYKERGYDYKPETN